MADTSKKARLPNFSPADTLILCEIMAEESCVAGLTKHAYLRHRFTSCGGPCPKSISPITDAVMSVIGKQSTSIRGISDFVDTSMLQLNSSSASSQVDNPLSSASTTRGQMVHAGCDDEPDEQSRSSFTATTNPDVTESIACNVLSSNYSAVQVVCCQCNCHRQLEILKEEKIRLQIRALKRQLEE